MKSYTAKNKLTYFLILATIALWGVIIFNIINYFKKDDQDNLTSLAKSSYYDPKTLPAKFTEVDIDTISFVELRKNPFEFESIISQAPKQVLQKYIPPPPALDFMISGVIINGDKKLAILNDLTNNKTIFLSEGDSYRSISIKSIAVERVTVMENHKEKVLFLKR